jgi:hypothetical protein
MKIDLPLAYWFRVPAVSYAKREDDFAHKIILLPSDRRVGNGNLLE